MLGAPNPTRVSDLALKAIAPAANQDAKQGCLTAVEQTVKQKERRALILELAAQGNQPEQIADILNQRGYAGANNARAINEVIRRAKQ